MWLSHLLDVAAFPVYLMYCSYIFLKIFVKIMINSVICS